MLSPGDRVVVAVSGGPDSLCLLHVLLTLRADLGIALHVAHLNHSLRGAESAADAEFVRTVAAQWGLPATVEVADVRGYRRAHHLSLEEAARDVRYEFLQRVALTQGATAIALAHTADDQVETVLMHLLRGAGASGLRAMLPVQPWRDNLRLVRPLLEVSRKDVDAYCAGNALQPRRDASNDDERIWRNRVRRRVLPFLEQNSPGLRSHLLRTADILATEDAYLQDQAAAVYGRVAILEGEDVTVALVEWEGLPTALQRRLLREVWRHAVGSYSDLSFVHVERARALITGKPGSTMNLPLRMRLQRGYTEFRLGKGTGAGATPVIPLLNTEEAITLQVPGTTPLPGSPWLVATQIREAQRSDKSGPQAALAELFDAGTVGRALVLRRRRPGDRMQPLGMAGNRKVHDIMVDCRIPRHLRAAIPLLATPDRVLWVAGARRSDWGKVTASTQQVLAVRFMKATEQTEAE